MSKIFQISGSYLLSGRWSFVGWIIKEETGEFIGFCEESCQKSYLTGKFTEKGIAFFKLSNDPQVLPQIFMIPDLKDQKGSWVVLSTSLGCFEKQGEARIKVEEDSSGKTEEFIEENYDIDFEIDYNADLIQQVDQCEEFHQAAL